MVESEKVLVVDIDGTLCPEKKAGQDYRDLPVEPALLARLKALKDDGWHIILHSARGMRTHAGNLGALYRHVLPDLHDWLDRHGVPYDEILLGKPWAGRDGFYIDDRAVRPREFLENDMATLHAMVVRDRMGPPSS